MPLSEHEQNLLEQMERALYAEDPKFASQMKGAGPAGMNRSRLIAGIAVALLGLGVVVFGVTIQQPIVGGVGFAVMVAGVVWALTPAHTRSQPRVGIVDAQGRVTAPRPTGTAKGRKARKGPKAKASGTFLQRMEERWDKRRRDQSGGW